MALFQHKQKSPIDDAIDRAEVLFDERYRDALQKYGREYFEKIIDKNAVLFKQDLDATIAHVYTDLKEHLSAKLDTEFTEYSKTMKAAQEDAVHTLESQHQQLGDELKKNVDYEEAMLTNIFEKSKTQMGAMGEAQDSALKTLTETVQSLQRQSDALKDEFAASIAAQKEQLTKEFETNMAVVVEHYLLGALGEQYDVKAQLPAILKQLETNKQAMMDDLSL